MPESIATRIIKSMGDFFTWLIRPDIDYGWIGREGFLSYMDERCLPLPSGADPEWQRRCELAVRAYNDMYGTRIDSFDGWYEWSDARGL